jgi:hypothetical protein
MGSKQIALDLMCNEFKGLVIRLLLLQCQAVGNPLRQLRRWHLFQEQQHAGLFKSRVPGTFLVFPVDLGQDDDGDRVGQWLRRQFLQHLAAFDAGFARRDVDLKDALTGKQ